MRASLTTRASRRAASAFRGGVFLLSMAVVLVAPVVAWRQVALPPVESLEARWPAVMLVARWPVATLVARLQAVMPVGLLVE